MEGSDLANQLFGNVDDQYSIGEDDPMETQFVGSAEETSIALEYNQLSIKYSLLLDAVNANDASDDIMTDFAELCSDRGMDVE